MVTNYSAPDAGDYNAPTPHAAQVAQDPYVAPSSGQNGVGVGGATCAGFEAMDNPPSGFSPTPGESMEMPEPNDVG